MNLLKNFILGLLVLTNQLVSTTTTPDFDIDAEVDKLNPSKVSYGLRNTNYNLAFKNFFGKENENFGKENEKGWLKSFKEFFNLEASDPLLPISSGDSATASKHLETIKENLSKLSQLNLSELDQNNYIQTLKLILQTELELWGMVVQSANIYYFKPSINGSSNRICLNDHDLITKLKKFLTTDGLLGQDKYVDKRLIEYLKTKPAPLDLSKISYINKQILSNAKKEKKSPVNTVLNMSLLRNVDSALGQANELVAKHLKYNRSALNLNYSKGLKFEKISHFEEINKINPSKKTYVVFENMITQITNFRIILDWLKSFNKNSESSANSESKETGKFFDGKIDILNFNQFEQVMFEKVHNLLAEVNNTTTNDKLKPILADLRIALDESKLQKNLLVGREPLTFTSFVIVSTIATLWYGYKGVRSLLNPKSDFRKWFRSKWTSDEEAKQKQQVADETVAAERVRKYQTGKILLLCPRPE